MNPRRRTLATRVGVVVAVVVMGLCTWQYAAASARLNASQRSLHHAQATLTQARAARDEQRQLRARALAGIRAARRDIAQANQAREHVETQLVDARQQLAGTNASLSQALVAVFKTKDASNDAQACLDGVRAAIGALARNDDHGAFTALSESESVCARTLVANNPTVDCAGNSLSSPAALQAFFNRRSDLWAGADLTGVVGLPDGRKLWLFGDTQYTAVNGNGSRGALTGFANNSAFIESGGCMRHVTGNGAQRAHQSWITPPQPGTMYWPGGGVVVGNTLSVFLGHLLPAPPFGQLLDRAVATFSLPDLRLLGVTPLPFSPSDIGWGASAIPGSDGNVYIYGTRRPSCAFCFSDDGYVARAPAGSVANAATWTYFDGKTWSPNPAAAKPILSGAGAQLSIKPFRGGWLAISKAADFLSNNIVAWWSPSPTGPWTSFGTIYQTPSYSAHSYTYMPDIISTTSTSIVYAFNVGTFSTAESAANASLYGPRFRSFTVPFVNGMR
jgi:hypothetical protein